MPFSALKQMLFSTRSETKNQHEAGPTKKETKMAPKDEKKPKLDFWSHQKQSLPKKSPKSSSKRKLWQFISSNVLICRKYDKGRYPGRKMVKGIGISEIKVSIKMSVLFGIKYSEV